MALDTRAVLVVLAVVALGGFVFTAMNVPWPGAPAPRTYLPLVSKDNAVGKPAGVSALPGAAGNVAAKSNENNATPKKREGLVPVDLHVMSICPDAVFCENHFSDVLEQVGEIMDLKTQYIAKPNGATFTCKHGPNECEGNRIQLCARQLYPETDKWFNFVLCQDETYRDIPTNTEACAKRMNLTATDIERCAKTDGLALLRASAALTESRNVIKSCTVFINAQKVCIRDGGTWYDCPNGNSVTDFVRQICHAYKGTDKPAACK